MMDAPKYRTDSQACSCPGYWYRRTCKHYRAYREAVALVLAQDAVNREWLPILANRAGIGDAVSPTPANIATVGVSRQPPIPVNLTPIGGSPQATIPAMFADMVK